MADEEKDANETEDTTEETTEETPAEATEEAPAEEKKKKVKKVVRRRKTKKERENPLTMAVRLAVESGKVEFGGKAGISSALQGSAKLFVVSNNTPEGIKVKVESFSKSAGIPLIQFEGNSMELGSVCGKPFPVTVLSVFETGSSNIMDLVKKK
jgi:large subunit ribosomal protein L30e